MSGADPLAQLRDIHLPPPVTGWPPAPGWWLLVLAGLLVLLGIFVWSRRRRRQAYRREALRSLDRLCERGAPLAEFCELLKRAAAARYGRLAVASLSGSEWVEFLNARTPAPLFDAAAEAALAARYRPDAGTADAHLRRCIRQWIARHR